MTAYRKGVHGDPYVPGHGDVRYAVRHYDLDLTYRLAGNHLTGTAVLHCEVRTESAGLEIDLYGLTVTKLHVDGARLARWGRRGARITLRFAAPLAAGTELTVTVGYRGVPRPMPGPDGRAGWEELEDGVIVASQPHGAPSWYPCNDRSDDKATYRIAVTTDPAYTVVANGQLVEDTRAGRLRRWVHLMTEPMAPYLATVQIGRYVRTPVGEGRVGVDVVHPAALADKVADAFRDQRAMLEHFEECFGPYPFKGYAAVVTADRLEIPLESQSLSTFGSNFANRGWEAQRLIAHELCHQWFGNSLTAAALKDIWLHEGFACYSEWLWSQEAGLASTDERAREHWQALSELPQDLVLADPGPRDMFDDRVYKRGALLLHALRLTVGDSTFFEVLQVWVRRHRYGVVTSEEFEALAREVSGRDLSGLFAAWLRARPLPPLPLAR